MALIVLDTSVLIAFLDPADEHHEPSRRALQSDEIVDSEWVAPATVCAELLVGAFRAGRRGARVVEQFLEEAVDRVEAMTLPIARRAAQLRADHSRLSLADAFVLATGEELESDMVLTSDRAWRRVSDRVVVV